MVALHRVLSLRSTVPVYRLLSTVYVYRLPFIPNLDTLRSWHISFASVR